MNQTIRYICPRCAATLELPAAAIGHQGRCPRCQHVFDVTAASAEPVAATTISHPLGAPAPPAGGPSDENPYAAPAAADDSFEEVADLRLRPAPVERAFDLGWAAYQANSAVMLLGGLLIFAFYVINSFAQAVSSALTDAYLSGGAEIALDSAISLLGTAVQQVLVAGLFLMGVEACRGGEPQLSTMLRPFQKLIPITVQYIIYVLISAVPVAVLAGPVGFWIWHKGVSPLPVLAGFLVGIVIFGVLLVITGYYWLALCLLADGRTGLLRSLGTGYRVLKISFWPTVLMTIVSVVISLAGLLACCVGLVFAMPFSSCLFAAIYVLGTGQPTMRIERRP